MPEEGSDAERKQAGYKLVPVINDYCIGCGKCVKACPHACLQPVWDFATLVRPDTCTSGGDCIPVCEDDAIEMKWVEMDGDGETGEWREEAPAEEPKRRLDFILWLLGMGKR